MKISSLFKVLGLSVLVAACTPKDINYFQDMPEKQQAIVKEYQDIRFKPGDRVSIVIKSKDYELSELYNLTIKAQRMGYGQGTSRGTGSQYMCDYTIDANGTVDMAGVGPIKIEGMTRTEVAAFVRGFLQSQNLVKDANVTVEYSDMNYYVLGDVSSPGAKQITTDHITLIEAIAKSGDLTITGNRKNVSVIRKEGTESKHYYVDMTNAESVYNSPVYYIQQNDVIYVEPNKKKARSSTENGNTVNSASFWVSICSAVLSMTSVIVNLVR